MLANENFMVSFGDVRGDPDQFRAWRTFMERLREHNAWYMTRYDIWYPDGGDWGWMCSTTPGGGRFTLAAALLQNLGFEQKYCFFDSNIARFDPHVGMQPPSARQIEQAYSRSLEKDL